MLIFKVLLFLNFAVPCLLAVSSPKSPTPLSAKVFRTLALEQQERYLLACNEGNEIDKALSKKGKKLRVRAAAKPCLIEYELNGQVVRTAALTQGSAEEIISRAFKSGATSFHDKADNNSPSSFGWEIQKGSSTYLAKVSLSLPSAELEKRANPGLVLETEMLIALANEDAK